MSFTDFTEVLQNPHFPEVQDISPEQVLKAQHQVALIDVREDDEWVGELGHIEGAKLINLGIIPKNFQSIPQDKTVVVVCKSGGRSARAAAFLKQQGYSHVFNMRGGMLLWNEKKFPTTQKK